LLFQAEDGIRAFHVTGVQTCALPISHKVIDKELKRLYPEIPVLSEEGKDIAFAERKNWKLFWLVDPLDGTKEFIKRNGEFTVNRSEERRVGKEGRARGEG